jgi:hypothetical protein
MCEEIYHTRMKEWTYKVLLEPTPINDQDDDQQIE